MLGKTELDPKSLMYEAYRIDGITPSQCRSIFLDWALCLPAGQNNRDAIQVMLDRYGTNNPDHPMSLVLRQGLEGSVTPKRRGGWRGRERPQ
ncbi:hypothetical protein [Parasedimentitalea huanghaiensis]|uniref:Uncharacterized protein n=1 Tax=Parasedimentitalea huanghaiensis TaxID=2682100 RepID=A0A6L6W935_9RHOB|nr:hypothetical protein [Zongyanglinia huanghaiensis]MVO14194.1 hypothetical protein [Zongyanglinia huanghaiensis]